MPRTFAATAGGAFAATTDGAVPASAGAPATQPTQELDLPTVAGDYALTLVHDTGQDAESLVITGDELGIDFVTEVVPVREHSAISDWRVTIPHGIADEEEILEWARARAYITFDERILFVGRLHRVNIQPISGTVSLEGTGLGGDLRAGDMIFEVEDVYAQEAIRECWDAVAPKWTVDVVTPGRGQKELIEHWPGRRFEDGFDGSPLQILQKIHEDLGFRFVIDRQRPYRAMSFKKGQIVRPETWETIETTPLRDVRGYYNKAIVQGAFDDDLGRRARGEYTDEAEVQRLMDETGRSEAEATITWRETDPELTTDWGCRLRAENRIEEFIEEDSDTATVRCHPTLVPPGPLYTLEAFDDERAVGPWSLQFDGSAAATVSLPSRCHPGAYPSEGAFTAWVKLPAEPAAGDAQFITSEGGEFGLSDVTTLTWTVTTTTEATASVDSYPDPDAPPDRDDDDAPVDPYPDAPAETWTLVHVDWRYNAEANTTTLRAGADGSVHEHHSVTVGGQLAPAASWSFGPARGYLDDPRLWRVRLSEPDYAALASAADVSKPMRHRWPLADAPGGLRDHIYDIIGECHGIRADLAAVEYAGNPLSLSTVDFREQGASAGGTLHFNETFELANEIARLRRDSELDRRFI